MALMVLSLGLAAPAAAQSVPPPPDVSVTSLGMQTWTDSSLSGLQDGADPQVPQPTDADLILGQRLRWTLAGDVTKSGPALLALADARFTVDPGGPEDTPPFEWSQVRQLGTEIIAGRWTVDVGRHPVFRGGPRLVDGVQALFAPSSELRLGLWAGLVPDLFTTLPTLRPGVGPILSYTTSDVQFSVVGDLSVYDGEIDRLGLLSIGRYTLERRLEASTRIDLELMGREGARLVDGQIVLIGTPNPAVRLDALYDAFSSYTYLGSEVLDPDLQRFAARLGPLGLADGLLQEVRDPTLNHLFGATARVQPDTDGAAPRVMLTARQRMHPDPANRYTRINPQAGVVGVGEFLDVLVDGNVILVDEATQLDGGLMLYLEPGDGTVSFDTSFRAIVAEEALGGTGLYADLFVNVVSVPLDLLFIAGGTVTTEPDPLDEQDSTGVGAFVRMAKYIRPARR
jgi:hypothetical protein